MLFDFILILLSSFVTLRRFRLGLGSGIAATVFFLVLLPTEVRLPTPGALPELTAHRILLMLAAWQVFKNRENSGPISLPGVGLITVVAIIRGCSTLISISFLPALKDFLGFILETALFFLVIGKGLRTPETVRKVAWSAMWALVAVAVIATIEKYRGINLAAHFIPGMLDSGREVTATFRHRILLGYSLAMGFPLVLGLWTLASTKKQRYAANVGMLMLPAACYFANSRGAWAGMALAGTMMAVTGSKELRRRLALLGVLGVAVLILRPGVLDTINSRWEHTKSTDTLKGKSASYRLELWRVAYNHLSKSPERFVLGYGGHSTQEMDLAAEFQYGGNAGALGYTSWDSEYAVTLMQFGFAGFLAELFLYLFLAKKCFDAWRLAPRDIQPLIAGCGAAVAVYLWAMTNVAIFNPQLKFLFWTMVAIPLRSVYLRWTEDSSTAEAAPTEPDTPPLRTVVSF